MKHFKLLIFSVIIISCNNDEKLDLLPINVKQNSLIINDKIYDLDYANTTETFFDGLEYSKKFKFSNTNSKGFGKKCNSCNYVYLNFRCYSESSVFEKENFEVTNDYSTVKGRNYCYVNIDNVSLSGKNEGFGMANGNLEIEILSKNEIDFSLIGESLEGMKISGKFKGEFNDSNL